MSPQRSALLPNVPTMVESGFADLNLSAWVGLLAPAKTPADIVAELNAAVHKALQGDFASQAGRAAAWSLRRSTPQELQATIAADIALHAELVKAAGINPSKIDNCPSRPATAAIMPHQPPAPTVPGLILQPFAFSRPCPPPNSPPA